MNTLEDIANWHYEMAKEMYAMASKSLTRNWCEACYRRYEFHIKAARLCRKEFQSQEAQE